MSQFTPVYKAIREGHDEVSQYLLEHGAKQVSWSIVIVEKCYDDKLGQTLYELEITFIIHTW